MIELSTEEFLRRAKNIRLVLSDNDGVLTDNGVYYSERGEELKRYSIRDGMGVERLAAVGVMTGIMTGETSLNLKKRAEKLKIKHLYLGIKDKLSKLNSVLSENGLALDEIAYMGDDVNDFEIMDAVAASGLTACPGDATGFVRPVVHYICKADGGDGAFREFAELLIQLRRS
ncbi:MULTISPECIES: KdsC family phosphatase [Prosthecochloris]|uniref:3-deoxy-D-manno-octulosonate 8-phosphate phosphatase n=1 Tax=Prosthecochloris marina TaxID=2017681 RepID=A0A317T573_9CHLB|nr:MULTISPECIES: HAD-IIIA family hydrolase [Prosthecochloris]PWW81862.1 3-deoxy-D-manno-octulosonate 8-phosphate phosphatase [Prosthecochloris marina]UZJ38552.1 HAD-IIIA family hydrolase [Prosthecochloris sp. SCSIO W1103]UZJ42407.1 HAD-IIIA family hydrolase [Prosthecochloris sp. SCSIO W1101]